MATKLSPRLEAIVDALPLKQGMRVLEIGCGPGAAAREIARRTNGFVLGIDRSATAIKQAERVCNQEIDQGRLEFRCVRIEDFTLGLGDDRFDIALAVRVGVLDGRHPKEHALALSRIKAALRKNGKFFIDGGVPLQEIDLTSITE